MSRQASTISPTLAQEAEAQSAGSNIRHQGQMLTKLGKKCLVKPTIGRSNVGYE